MGEQEYRKAVLPFLQAVEEAAVLSTVEPYAAAGFGIVVIVVIVVEIDLDLGLDLVPEVSTVMERRASARVVVVAACAD